MDEFHNHFSRKKQKVSTFLFDQIIRQVLLDWKLCMKHVKSASFSLQSIRISLLLRSGVWKINYRPEYLFNTSLSDSKNILCYNNDYKNSGRVWDQDQGALVGQGVDKMGDSSGTCDVRTTLTVCVPDQPPKFEKIGFVFV